MPTKGIITQILTVAALTLIAAIAYESRNEIATMVSTAHWWQLALAISSLTLANIGMAIVFADAFLPASKHTSSRNIITGSFLLSQVGKYIPGRIWGMAMQAMIIRGLGATGNIFAVNIELTIANLAMVTGIGIAFLTWPKYGFPTALIVLIATWLTSSTLLSLNLSKRITAFMRNALPRVGKKLAGKLSGNQEALNGKTTTKAGGLLVYILMYCLGWWLLAKATTHHDAITCMGIVAALSLSYIAGVASLLPAGIGAREGTLILLAPTLGITHESMTALAVASRAAMILMDILTACIGAILLKKNAPRGDMNV